MNQTTLKSLVFHTRPLEEIKFLHKRFKCLPDPSSPECTSGWRTALPGGPNGRRGFLCLRQVKLSLDHSGSPALLWIVLCILFNKGF